MRFQCDKPSKCLPVRGRPVLQRPGTYTFHRRNGRYPPSGKLVKLCIHVSIHLRIDPEASRSMECRCARETSLARARPAAFSEFSGAYCVLLKVLRVRTEET
jgi:hypothetical protein